MDLSEDFARLPDEIKIMHEKIEGQDLFVFVDEIDVEGMAYKYLHALNQFRYEYHVSQNSLSSLLTSSYFYRVKSKYYKLYHRRIMRSMRINMSSYSKSTICRRGFPTCLQMISNSVKFSVNRLKTRMWGKLQV